MARPPRLTIPGMPMHVTQRGTDRLATFLHADDFAAYLSCLRHASRKHGCAIHAYVLMTNHVHLLLTPDTTTSASQLMQTVGRLYVRYFNDRYRRTGALWESRFRSAIVETRRYFLACSRYIDLNPVRAGIVSNPAAYAWSSFAHSAFGRPDPLLVPHAEMLALGQTQAERERAYRAMCTPASAQTSAVFIRRSTYRGAMIGTASARTALAAEVGRPVARPPRGGARPRAGRPRTRPAAAHAAG